MDDNNELIADNIIQPTAKMSSMTLSKHSSLSASVDSARELRIQIASDIHLEMFPTPTAITRRIPGHENHDETNLTSSKFRPIIRPSAPILALLGDIGCPATHLQAYQMFLFEMADRFEHVLVLAGNHEYYQATFKAVPKTVAELKEIIQETCDQRSNLHFLDRKSIVINGVRICGATLWSYIPPEHMRMVSHAMNDYRCVYMAGETKFPMPKKESKGVTYKTIPVRSLTVTDTMEWHKQDVEWLQEQIQEAKAEEQPVVMLTHHAPLKSNTSHPKYEGDPLSSAFSSNLDDLFVDPVHTWAFGHTHYNTDFEKNGVRVVANQFGYYDEGEKSGYRSDFVLHISSED